MPSMELTRAVSSGTEATMSAIRVARGFSGKSGIIKFAGCYHGHSDSLLVDAGSGALTLGIPSSEGVPPAAVADTWVLQYNDAQAVSDIFAAQGNNIAAIIVEPDCRQYEHGHADGRIFIRPARTVRQTRRVINL